MRTNAKHTVTALLTIALPAAAAQAPGEVAIAPATPPAAAAPAAHPAATIAAPRHASLAALAGRWTVTQSMWTAPTAAPAIDRGTATYAMVLGGRHLRQELRVVSGGKTFQGLGYIGYDAAVGTYYSAWMDTNFDGLLLAHGAYDAARRTYTFVGTMAAPGNGAPIPVREVLRVADDDHFDYAYYETRDGKEAIAIRLEYARVR